MTDCFTIVFSGRLSDFEGNPFKTETVFGKAIAVGVGNALEENDKLRDLVEDYPQESANAPDPDAWMREDGTAVTINPMIAAGWRSQGFGPAVPLYAALAASEPQAPPAISFHSPEGIPCNVCGGSGFSGHGTGYDDVCGECGGLKYFPRGVARGGKQ